jgi:hypothetical protein
VLSPKKRFDMSQPLHPPKAGTASSATHPWNQAERQAQADRVITRAARQHGREGERPKEADATSPRRFGQPEEEN